MTHILPWVALALAAAALLAREPSRGDTSSAGPTPLWLDIRAHSSLLIAMAVLAAVALLSGWKWNEAAPGALPAAGGLLLGFFVAVLAHVADLAQAGSLAGSVVPIALAGAAVGATAFGQQEAPLPLQLGLIAGASLGAWLLNLRRKDTDGSWAAIAAIVCAAVVAVNYLGEKAAGERAGEAGLALAVVAVLAGLLGTGVARFVQRQRGEGGSRTTVFVAVAAALLLIGGWLAGQRYLFMQDVWLIFGGSVLAGLVVNWFLPDGEQPFALRFLIAAVVWIAIATIAFGMRKGYGMSISLFGAMSALVLVGNRRAILTLGPVLALVLFRVFREAYPDAYRAIDIGQHYAMIGLLLGIALPLMPIDWAKLVPSGRITTAVVVAGALWVVLLIGVQPAASVLLGAKGVVGFVVGLGFGSAIESLRGGISLHVPSLAAGMAAVSLISYGWLGDHLNKARDEKLGALYWVLGALFLLGLVVAALTPRDGELEKNETAS
jgi:hypothetical protein